MRREPSATPTSSSLSSITASTTRIPSCPATSRAATPSRLRLFDFANMVGNMQPQPLGPGDHGTACASAAVANTNNASVVAGISEGIAGVAGNCRLIGILRGGTEARYAEMYLWAAGFDPGSTTAGLPRSTCARGRRHHQQLRLQRQQPDLGPDERHIRPPDRRWPRRARRAALLLRGQRQRRSRHDVPSTVEHVRPLLRRGGLDARERRRHRNQGGLQQLRHDGRLVRPEQRQSRAATIRPACSAPIPPPSRPRRTATPSAATPPSRRHLPPPPLQARLCSRSPARLASPSVRPCSRARRAEERRQDGG